MIVKGTNYRAHANLEYRCCTIEIPGKICGFDRDCFVASLLAMTGYGRHCELALFYRQKPPSLVIARSEATKQSLKGILAHIALRVLSFIYGKAILCLYNDQ